MPLVYLNRVGGQDELVFDGSSFVTNDDGSIAVQMPDFEEAMVLTDWVQDAQRLALRARRAGRASRPIPKTCTGR